MSIVRIRPLGKDEYGDPIAGTPERATITGAFTAPRMADDIEGRARDGVVVGLTLFAPYGADIEHTDLIEVNGTEYRIDGDRADWLQPWTGWEAGSTVPLVRSVG